MVYVDFCEKMWCLLIKCNSPNPIKEVSVKYVVSLQILPVFREKPTSSHIEVQDNVNGFKYIG